MMYTPVNNPLAKIEMVFVCFGKRSLEGMVMRFEGSLVLERRKEDNLFETTDLRDLSIVLS